MLVTTTADGGAGSLRAAIANAISGDTIQFQVGGTITLASELPVIAKNLTIDGNGNNPTISGAGTYRPFFIGDAGTTGSTYAVTLKNLAIADAVAQGGAGVGAGAGAGLGGAIFVSSNGALTLANVAVSNTQAKGGSVVDNPSQVGGGGGMGGKSAPYTPGGGGGLFVGSDAPGSSDGGGPNPGLSNNVASGPATGGAGGFASGGGGASSNGGPLPVVQVDLVAAAVAPMRVETPQAAMAGTAVAAALRLARPSRLQEMGVLGAAVAAGRARRARAASEPVKAAAAHMEITRAAGAWVLAARSSCRAAER
ncbi:hypothetical protein ACVOMS_27810 [Bradyrhizobium guangxiense]